MGRGLRSHGSPEPLSLPWPCRGRIPGSACCGARRSSAASCGEGEGFARVQRRAKPMAGSSSQRDEDVLEPGRHLGSQRQRGSRCLARGWSLESETGRRAQPRPPSPPPQVLDGPRAPLLLAEWNLIAAPDCTGGVLLRFVCPRIAPRSPGHRPLLLPLSQLVAFRLEQTSRCRAPWTGMRAGTVLLWRGARRAPGRAARCLWAGQGPGEPAGTGRQRRLAEARPRCSSWRLGAELPEPRSAAVSLALLILSLLCCLFAQNPCPPAPLPANRWV